MCGQTLTYSGYIYNAGGLGASNVPVKLYKRTTSSSVVSNLTTKIYSTHGGNGNTSQYSQYPSSVSEMDRCFNTSYSNTLLKWSGSVAATTCLNWGSWGTLSSAGITIPNNGEYFSVEVTATFIPKETGTYTFGVNSDDGGDILIGGNLITSYYGGHGMSGPVTGTVYLVAGASYSFKARMQEYGGGEGLIATWKRPSQSVLTLQTDEIGVATTVTTAWSLYKTVYTDLTGKYAINESTTTSTEWYFVIDAPTPVTSLQNSDAYGANTKAISRTFTSLDYYRYDVNNDGRINISDAYYIFMKKLGRLPTWGTSLPNKRLFTSTEYTTINSSTSDLRSTYVGSQSITITSPVSGGSSNYYLVNTGYSNSTTIGY
jgi:hypothetical protein